MLALQLSFRQSGSSSDYPPMISLSPPPLSKVSQFLPVYGVRVRRRVIVQGMLNIYHLLSKRKFAGVHGVSYCLLVERSL
jgi:hypothetical protein